jgi:acyl carrier protein
MRCHDARRAAPLEERALKILCEKLAVNREGVTHSSSLETDLGADSLAIVELLMSVEEELGIVIPDEEAQKMKTVGDILDYICRCYPRQGGK